MSRRVLIAGVGREGYGDDAVGPMLARRVAGRLGHGAVCRTGCPADVLDDPGGYAAVRVIDAALASKHLQVGRWLRLEVPADLAALEMIGCGSTHAYDLVTMLRLHLALGALPPEVTIFAVGGGDFSPESHPSAEVVARLDAIVDEIVANLSGADAGKPLQTAAGGPPASGTSW